MSQKDLISRESIRNLWRVLAIVALAWLPATVTTAACHCFCGVSTQLGYDDRDSLPDQIIDYGRAKDENGNEIEWPASGCSFPGNTKWTQCREACDRTLDQDQERWGNDAWLCENIGRPFSGQVAAYHTIGNRPWRELDRRPVRCKRCCQCEQGWYDGDLDSCVICTGCPVPGMPDGDKGGGYSALNGQLLMSLPGATECQIVPGSGSCKPPCEDCEQNDLVVDVSTASEGMCDRNGALRTDVELFIDGGTAPYEIDYDGPPHPGLPVTEPGPTIQILGLVTGTFQLTVTDADGTQTSVALEIVAPTFDLMISAVPTSCQFCTDGSATVVAQGGSPPFTYRWDDGQNTATATDLPSGTHGVIVTDARGCFQQVSVTVKPNNTP